MNAREQALELLDRWHRSRRFADELLDDALDRSPLSGPDRALTTELFYGCLRHRSVLERLVTDLAARPPRPALAWVVQLGLYQLFFLDRVPAHAAVHETVAVGKKHVSPGEVGFVNALLRQASARREELQRQIAGWRTTEPWVYHSQPRWLWDRWVARWGAEQADALCAWNNKPAPVYVRVNTLRMGTRSGEPRVATAEPRTPPHPSPQTTAGPASPPEGRGDRNATRVLQGKSRSLEDPPLPSGGEGWGEGETIKAPEPLLDPTPLHPLCRRVTNPAGLFRTGAWLNGEFYVQDPSTLLAVDLLDPQPGETVLDMCAAPGGKTTYLAQKMANRGRIFAADASASRLGLVAENCRRLGVTIAATLACEGTRLERCLRGTQCDRVLVDAPCSNTGVLRRRVDLRWQLAADEIPRLAAQQARLLAAAAALVRSGGVLVYSTCSLEPEENDRMTESFVQRHPGFVAEDRRTVFPPQDSMDGAFIARFRKT